MKTFYKHDRRSGFSMIEVLVAATILLVIVMMLAMLFQQTSIAWRTGVRRADAFTQVRTLIGAMQRDAAKAVDEECIAADLRTGKSQNFGSAMSFFTLSGNGFDDSGNPIRSVSYIQYAGGNRTETELLADGSWSSPKSSLLTKFVEWSGSDTVKMDLPAVSVVDNPAGGLPLCVKFTVSVTSEGYNLEIGAASAGPDGAWGTRDDIRTWVE